MAKGRSSGGGGGSQRPSLMKYSRQSTSSSTATTTTTATNNNRDQQQLRQKFITTDTSLSHVLTMISMGICRRITSQDLIHRRLMAYVSLVVVGGLLNDFAPVIPRAFMFKTQKTNPLNVWFVKIGWFWTLTLITPLIAITATILERTVDGDGNDSANESLSALNGDARHKNAGKDIGYRLKRLLTYLRTRQLFRLLANTAIWYVSVNLFFHLEDITGFCSNNIDAKDSIITTKNICIKSGHKWLSGFDISGHTFLLIFSNLILIEECAVMLGWEPFGNQLFMENTNIYDRPDIVPDREQYRLYTKYAVPLRILFLLITSLSLIWDFMLLQTSLFYHTMIQKLIACVWAIIAWFITYKYLYKRLDIDVKPPKLNKNL